MKDIQHILELIEEIKTKNKLVIVEGIKDQKALTNLGIIKVLQLRQKPLYKIVEEIAENAKEVVLLVDLDPEGKKIYNKLAQDLQRHKVKIDNKLREALFKTPLRQIEGLDTYIDRVKEEGCRL
ncbi:toprim domain-containing protein [Candidatus Woesearchaeota archaeon]|nr:toprim domain-containing protein [Candidatus Woesearchaeota archaeon]